MKRNLDANDLNTDFEVLRSFTKRSKKERHKSLERVNSRWATRVTSIETNWTVPREETPHAIHSAIPLEDTPSYPQRLCRAILPALFPAWVSPRFTIGQLTSAYANSSLQDCMHTLGQNASKLCTSAQRIVGKPGEPSLHFASHSDRPDKFQWL